MTSAWIEKLFAKRECTRFVADESDWGRCACGLQKSKHPRATVSSSTSIGEPWSVMGDTKTCRTDAYGSIEFEGSSRPDITKFIRLDYATPPRDIVQLLVHHWNLEQPRLLVTIYGCSMDGQGRPTDGEFLFEPKLKKALRKGIRKIASTNGCWLFTSGKNDSILNLIKDAMIKQTACNTAGNIISMAHWGSIPERQNLVGKGVRLKYRPALATDVHGLCLSCHQKCLLLLDDGTANKGSCETTFRQKLESYVSEKECGLGKGVPAVCLIIGGGADIMQVAAGYATSVPPVPVIVCEGTGGCADLVALGFKMATRTGELSDGQKLLLLGEAGKLTAHHDGVTAADVFGSLCKCLKSSSTVSTFSIPYAGAPERSLDSVLLAALLRGCEKSSFQEQLSLTISWSRPDLAQDYIFRNSRSISVDSLHGAMKHALTLDKVDFVSLLLDKGVNMKLFLTKDRLEELYNVAPTNVGSRFILDMLLKNKGKGSHNKVKLVDIGQIISRLMGSGYHSAYTKSPRSITLKYSKPSTASLSGEAKHELSADDIKQRVHFELPHNELMIWAILTDRKKLPKFMWQNEQEVLAKAVVASKLYTVLANELESSPFIDRLIMEDCRHRARKFEMRAMETLDMCYRQSSTTARRLLSCPLSNWNNENVLSMAASAGMRDFVAHPCCQDAITEMWLGGLTVNKHASLKVLCGIFVPPAIPALCFRDQLDTSQDIMHSCFLNKAFDDSLQDPLDDDSQGFFHSSGINLSPTDASMTGQKEKTYTIAPLIHKGLTSARLRAFYNAPITKFWMHTIAFCVFLMTLSYTVLVKMDNHPGWTELFSIAYVFFLALEMIREVSMCASPTLTSKLWIFFGDMWNVVDTVACLVFLAGFILRLLGEQMLLLWGKIIYSLAAMIWFLRTLENLSVNRTIGYFTAVICNMTSIIYKFCVLAAIFVAAFGIPKQGIRFPLTEASWELLSNVTLKPYFILYGELYKTEINSDCGDAEGQSACWPGLWLHPLLEAVYLMIVMAAIVNVFFTWINVDYQAISNVSDKLWMFQRYSLVLGYRDTLVLPPPLTFTHYFFLACRRISGYCKGTNGHATAVRGSHLHSRQLEYLRSYEEQCVFEGLMEKDTLLLATKKKRVKKTHETMCKLDAVSSHKQITIGSAKKSATLTAAMMDINDMKSSLQDMFAAVHSMENHMSAMETLAQKRLELIGQLAKLVSDHCVSIPQLHRVLDIPALGSSMRQLSHSSGTTVEHNETSHYPITATSGIKDRDVRERKLSSLSISEENRSDAKHQTQVSHCVHGNTHAMTMDCPINKEVSGEDVALESKSRTEPVPPVLGANMMCRNEAAAVCDKEATGTAKVEEATMPKEAHFEANMLECTHFEYCSMSTPSTHITRSLPHPIIVVTDVSFPPSAEVAVDAYLLQEDCDHPSAIDNDDYADGKYGCVVEKCVFEGEHPTEVSQPPSEIRRCRPTWLPLNMATSLPEGNVSSNSLPCSGVISSQPSTDAEAEVLGEENLLRCIEENAALIIGKRLQGKMAASGGCLHDDCSPAEWSLPSTHPLAQVLSSSDLLVGPPAQEQCSKDAATNAEVVHGLDTVLSGAEDGRHSHATLGSTDSPRMLQNPSPFSAQPYDHITGAPSSDNSIMLRNFSEHSFYSVAASDISTHTETSLLGDT